MAKKKTVKKAAAKKAAPKKQVTKTVNSVGVMPLGDRVLIKPLSAEDTHKTTSFGIIIPDTVEKEKSDRGVVVAVGRGKRNEKGERVPVEVSVGDRVLYTKPWNEPVKIGGVEHYLIAESDILAVLN